MTISPIPQEPTGADIAASVDPMVFQHRTRPFRATHSHPYETKDPRVIPPAMLNDINPIRSCRPSCSRELLTPLSERMPENCLVSSAVPGCFTTFYIETAIVMNLRINYVIHFSKK